MGFFSSCFACNKDQNQRRGCKRVTSRNKVNHDHQTCPTNPSPQKSILKDEPLVSNSEPRENNERVKSGASSKKVTFDLNVTKYETTRESYEYDETSESEEEFNEILCCPYDENGDKKEKVFSVSKYRYENCESSDDEGLDDELNDDIVLNDVGKAADAVSIGAESYDSFFSIPLGNEKQKGKHEEVVKASSILDLIEKFNGLKDDSLNVLHIKNSKETHESDLRNKVNVPEYLVSLNSSQRRSNKECLVDASLSTWLSASQVK